MIGCKASMILTTSDGARRLAYSNIPNGRIVPKKITVATDETNVGVSGGTPTQNGCKRLKKSPAIIVPQPKTTKGGLVALAFWGKTT